MPELTPNERMIASVVVDLHEAFAHSDVNSVPKRLTELVAALAEQSQVLTVEMVARAVDDTARSLEMLVRRVHPQPADGPLSENVDRVRAALAEHPTLTDVYREVAQPAQPAPQPWRVVIDDGEIYITDGMLYCWLNPAYAADIAALLNAGAEAQRRVAELEVAIQDRDNTIAGLKIEADGWFGKVRGLESEITGTDERILEVQIAVRKGFEDLFQDAVIDGSGSDGDWGEFTLDELQQGLNLVKEAIAERDAAIAKVAKLEAEREQIVERLTVALDLNTEANAKVAALEATAPKDSGIYVEPPYQRRLREERDELRKRLESAEVELGIVEHERDAALAKVAELEADLRKAREFATYINLVNAEKARNEAIAKADAMEGELNAALADLRELAGLANKYLREHYFPDTHIPKGKTQKWKECRELRAWLAAHPEVLADADAEESK